MLTHPRVGAVAAVIGLLALGAAPATAVGRAAAALGAEDGYLTGIACVNKANCVAVGNDANPGSVSVTLAELWNGTHWTVLPTPNPVGARGSKFHGVSCSETSSCIAVGYSLDRSDNSLTLVERWNGITWQILPSPNPRRATSSELDSVACVSASDCTAVGSVIGSRPLTLFTLAEHWNGSVWKLVTTPNAKRATMSGLDGVECLGASDCTAVGTAHFNADTAFTLAEHWNGSVWKLVTTRNPTGSTESFFDGITCSGVVSCQALGTYEKGSATSLTLGEHWDGAAWKVVPTSNPATAKRSYLAGVACVSTSDCMAVGAYLNSTLLLHTLAERWDGASWKIVTTPNPAGLPSRQFNGVACNAPSSCMAVGTSLTGSGTFRALAEHWNGASWKIVTTPEP